MLLLRNSAHSGFPMCRPVCGNKLPLLVYDRDFCFRNSPGQLSQNCGTGGQNAGSNICGHRVWGVDSLNANPFNCLVRSERKRLRPSTTLEANSL